MLTTLDRLAASLLEIAAVTSDSTMANTARYHEEELRKFSGAELERFVKSLRDNLNYYKSDYRDSLDRSARTQGAIDRAYEAAKQTIDEIIRSR